ncbi:hypothetical protein GbCGDNIH6_7104 [Granulibacter bethesdensis]|nr:hypothetical protein GbCGDNIH6_7104 [Granulibacter bethesdensis]
MAWPVNLVTPFFYGFRDAVFGDVQYLILSPFLKKRRINMILKENILF